MGTHHGKSQQPGCIHCLVVIDRAKSALYLTYTICHKSFGDIYGHTIVKHEVCLQIHNFMKCSKWSTFWMMGYEEINTFSFFVQTIRKEYFGSIDIDSG